MASSLARRSFPSGVAREHPTAAPASSWTLGVEDFPLAGNVRILFVVTTKREPESVAVEISTKARPVIGSFEG